MFREVWSTSKVKDGKHIDRILRSGDKKNEKGEIQWGQLKECIFLKKVNGKNMKSTIRNKNFSR